MKFDKCKAKKEKKRFKRLPTSNKHQIEDSLMSKSIMGKCQWFCYRNKNIKKQSVNSGEYNK